MNAKQFLDQRCSEVMIGEDDYVYIGPFFRFCFRTSGSHVIVSAEVYVPLPGFFKWIEIGQAVLSPERMKITLPPFEIRDPLFGTLLLKVQTTFELDVKRCVLNVSTYLFIVGIYEDTLTISVPYALPFPVTPPQWDRARVTEEKIKETARTGKRVDGVPGAQALQADPGTQKLMKGLLYLTGASTAIDDAIGKAREIERLSTKTRGSEADVLLAVGISGSGGLIGGIGGGVGLYFTSRGEFGVYGSVQLSFGVLASISLDAVGSLFWGTGGKSALENFCGRAIVIGGNINFDDPPVGVGGAMYFPADQGSNPKVPPVGFSLSLGVGVGSPLEFYVGNCWTFASTLIDLGKLQGPRDDYANLVCGKSDLVPVTG